MLVENRWWTSASADSRQRVGQVLVEGADLAGEQQALVDHRAASRATACRAAARPGRSCLRGQLGQRVLGLLADRQQLALEGVLVLDVRARGR